MSNFVQNKTQLVDKYFSYTIHCWTFVKGKLSYVLKKKGLKYLIAVHIKQIII